MGALLFFKIYKGDFLATLISIVSMLIRWFGLIMVVGGDVVLGIIVLVAGFGLYFYAESR